MLRTTKKIPDNHYYCSSWMKRALNKMRQTTILLTFNVTLNRASTKNITVVFAIGKEGDSAKEGATEDYTHAYVTPTKRILTFTNASSESTDDRKEIITVTIIGDAYNETDELFTITLSNPTNAKFLR